jgi:hypothetical protein
MTKLIFFSLLLTFTSAFAQEEISTPILTTTVANEREFKPRKGHWLATFGFESMKYERINDFTASRKTFKPDEIDLWGGRLGLGREFYLGAGFITSTRLEGFYVGTLFAKSFNGGTFDSDVEFAFTKQTGQVAGGDIAQTLGWMFDMKTKNPFMDEMTYLTVEPFIEAGMGVAWAYNRTNYSYDTGTAPTAARESYRLKVRDDLANARIGAGINFTSSTGFFLYLRATQNRYDILKRKIEGFSQPTGSGRTDISTIDKEAKIKPITAYAIGGGYKF